MKPDFPNLASEAIDQNAFAFAVRDGFPVSAGHTLIIPRRHVRSIFELAADELADCWALLARQRELLASTCDGFNVGVNDGAAAGQTIGRAHIHLIPRRHGDVAAPRGGVRGVIPGKANY